MSRAKMSTTVFPPGEGPKGKTELERFDNVMDRLLSVPKDLIGKRTRAHSRRPKTKK